jgi:hypothetical protein
LANPPASGTKGYYYIVSTAGTFASISFEVGDWIISDGTAWGKVDNTDAVSSVFGRTGNVVASNGDYTTAQVTESGNLYYTDGRSRGALSFVAGSGAYNSSTGVITIPTNNNQITNGAGYITSAALSGYLPLTGGTLTGPLGGTSASFSGIITTTSTSIASGNFGGNSASWEGNSQYPTLFGSSADRWIMHINPHVSYTQNGVNGFTGSMAGATIRFASNPAAANYWDIGVGTNSVGTDTFSIGRNGSNLFRISNAGVTTLANLAGSGNRMVVADANGVLSTQAIGSGAITGSGTTNYLPKFTGSTTIGNSLFFDDGTRVGINTASISNTTLTIYDGTGNGDILKVDTNGTKADIWLKDSGTTNGAVRIRSESNALRFITGGDIRSTIFNDGNFLLTNGSGSNAGFKLDVNGTGRFSNILVANSDIHQVSTGGLYWGAASTYVIGVTGNTANGNLSFITGSTVKLTLASTGAATFSGIINANSAATAANGSINIDNSDPTLRFRRAGGTANKSIYEWRAIAFGGDNDRMELRLWNDAQSSVSNLMSITSGGNLLIGTQTNAGVYRTVFSNSTGGQAFIGITNQTGADGNRALRLGFDSGATVATIQGTSINVADDINISLQAGGGNVLIGTTTDNGNRLRVNGTIFSDSSVTATSFFESSDATIKTLVEDAYQAKGIDSVVAKLYIKNGKQELGYYAQDLEAVLPSAVSKGSNGLLNLSYREVHTAKLQFLEQKVKELEAKLS